MEDTARSSVKRKRVLTPGGCPHQASDLPTPSACITVGNKILLLSLWHTDGPKHVLEASGHHSHEENWRCRAKEDTGTQAVRMKRLLSVSRAGVLGFPLVLLCPTAGR
jgi:hypothetical protein